MEDKWVPQLIETLDRGVAARDLGCLISSTVHGTGADTYVLCEINASSCFAMPDEAPAGIAPTVKACIARRSAQRSVGS